MDKMQSDYANKGWYQEQADRLARIKTLHGLSHAVTMIEIARPGWVKDATIIRLRASYLRRYDALSK